MPTRIPLLDERALARTLARMATEIVERAHGTDGLVLVGIQRRGVELAVRLKRSDRPVRRLASRRCGKLDITLYSDDLQTVGPRPGRRRDQSPRPRRARPSSSWTTSSTPGRTVRAALDEFADFGRPRRILLCVLIDRGGRELPIQADIVGTSVSAGPGDRVDVLVTRARRARRGRAGPRRRAR